jgi:hypothetical protein
MWMVRHDRPLTNYTKSRMGLGHALCTYCGNIEETVLHALRDFPCKLEMNSFKEDCWNCLT